jgi:hypothetical protein
MAIDFSKDVESLTPEQVDTEISEIRGSDIYQNKHPSYVTTERDKYLNRMDALYQKKLPEGGRRSIPETDRPLHDTLSKIFPSPEDVTKEATEARQKIVDEYDEQEYQKADSELKQMWGPQYQENLNIVKFAVDTFFPEAGEREKVIEEFGNDVSFMDALAYIAERLGSVFGWLEKAKNYKRTKGDE